MASPLRVGYKIQHRRPVLVGAFLSPATNASAPNPIVRVKKWSSGRGTPRRLVLGFGASFLSQFMSMAGRGGGQSFFASARQQGGSSVEQVLKNVEWPEQFPFKEEDFKRFDESPDSLFYETPRFVTHIDDPAIAALTKYYSKVFPPSNSPGVSHLDLCSSWVSHFPAGYKQERIVGMGMNEEELKRNPVSVDYLSKPIDVFKEMSRILKPGGLAIMSFSNRCFWTKAISIWTSTGDADHALIVGSYFHYAGGFEPPQAVDISPNPGRSDPMYIVYSTRVATA
ncbi:uncharacterized protein LOC122656607 isoform X2 [Telopea speciosissima]|uniref:uncharacterized protein LOC122656607 isoform X2 n=1 Tax=Telopea speciosissima TaxID=54955 RepID=UPI001CC38714|nr:uncharacterized protein LOC122656607 isoform X2 [Telopea speciosissima]